MSHSSNKKMKLEDHLIEDSDSDALVIDEGSDSVFERDSLNVYEVDSDSDRLVIDEDRDCCDDPAVKRDMFGRPLRPIEPEERERSFEVNQANTHEHYAKYLPIMNQDLKMVENIGEFSGIDCSRSSEDEEEAANQNARNFRRNENSGDKNHLDVVDLKHLAPMCVAETDDWPKPVLLSTRCR